MDAPIYPLHEVFVLSGTPEHTFVQPVEYMRLLVALRTPGRSIVVEGPSGIGKTTAINKAIAEAGLGGSVLPLSARKKDDVTLISELPRQLPLGIVVVDDFHRLDDNSKKDLADLMKTLADEGSTHSKIIVIGIPNAGQSLISFGKDLISFGKDLANRLEIIPFESNPENKVAELVTKGEVALRISINIREDIIIAARGSFYIAQMLADHTCIRSGITQTRATITLTEESYESVKTDVMETLKRSFHETVIAFCRGTKLKREGRAPYLHLLYWLSESNNWSINAIREANKHSAQKGSVSQVVTKGFLVDLIHSSEDVQKVLHFDSVSNTLVAQDPQFVFYIRNMSWPIIAEEVGFLSMEFPSRYDFALSFAGEDRTIAESLFNALQDNELEVFYDKNERHRILAENVEEYLAPIYASEAQFVICILGPTYPTKIWTKFESKQFRERFKNGEVIPILLDTTQPGVFDLANDVGHITWATKDDPRQQVETITSLLLRKCAETRGSSPQT